MFCAKNQISYMKFSPHIHVCPSPIWRQSHPITVAFLFICLLHLAPGSINSAVNSSLDEVKLNICVHFKYTIGSGSFLFLLKHYSNKLITAGHHSTNVLHFSITITQFRPEKRQIVWERKGNGEQSALAKRSPEKKERNELEIDVNGQWRGWTWGKRGEKRPGRQLDE